MASTFNNQQQSSQATDNSTNQTKQQTGKSKSSKKRKPDDMENGMKRRRSVPCSGPVGWFDLGEDCRVGYFKGVVQSWTAIKRLTKECEWMQREVKIMGRLVMQPRLVYYMADDESLTYTYSGLKLKPHQWHPVVKEIKGQAELVSGEIFNSCLLNFYRDGDDYISFHSDNEPHYGPNPTIASVSLGATRDFILRNEYDAEHKILYELSHGDVLVMAGATQKHWRHGVPKRANVTNPRINLTFRKIVEKEKDLEEKK